MNEAFYAEWSPQSKAHGFVMYMVCTHACPVTLVPYKAPAEHCTVLLTAELNIV